MRVIFSISAMVLYRMFPAAPEFLFESTIGLLQQHGVKCSSLPYGCMYPVSLTDFVFVFG